MSLEVDVVLLPRDLTQKHWQGRTVIVFDVLRATTTMTAALAAGARGIRYFSTLDAAKKATQDVESTQRPLLCGEIRCLKPDGFDMGNSPGSFTNEICRDRLIFMATTNGTRALGAAAGAHALLVGALVNANAVARKALQLGNHVTLLCSGADGALAMEDLIGCGAVIAVIQEMGPVVPMSDSPRLALKLFEACRMDLVGALAQSQGGRNLAAAGLGMSDVEFAARLNCYNVVGAARDGIIAAE